MRKLLVCAALAVLVFAMGAGVAAGAERSLVKMETSKGDIVIELFPDKAPKTVANFLAYVKAGAYDGTIFHRVMDGFMIQGGGFEPDMRPRPTTAPIRNEADNGLKNERYTLAMARTNDPHSASNQFFINVANNDFLNYTSKTSQGWGYAVFGKVVDGMRVVDAIKGVPTGNKGGHQNVPRDPVIIKKAYVFTLR
ncbi:peptidyl-prolyl cis-trans isomerase B (rotamase B) [uncultured delta proteobacterium]|uniref:Peptidyl-prolyl cis-trans isomerase n=1 Tax=uncultured delta proteobacterium TaxID=34034 RepID=A0A212J6T6_9DELT|nr:peptidyl-prolyl cis-trans isomerase B (rotamase B) [uncultured delta proteobacterium]